MASNLLIAMTSRFSKSPKASSIDVTMTMCTSIWQDILCGPAPTGGPKIRMLCFGHPGEKHMPLHSAFALATLDPNQRIHVGSVLNAGCEGPNPSELRVLPLSLWVSKVSASRCDGWNRAGSTWKNARPATGVSGIYHSRYTKRFWR